jgi:hypothetical protein
VIYFAIANQAKLSAKKLSDILLKKQGRMKIPHSKSTITHRFAVPSTLYLSASQPVFCNAP